ncbi:Delta-1-pyrroline-5-carboxylate dehydrogenase [Acropora cervicornis]|uniref:L-glutamate gamma-semialdehyde dehydrogenase n=1 Tax=Acropora cervicornis TaxID=6130 RepID=A0AAD9UV78_ACRCE|nr:Delta-1-pyrroline-5-carboxylate dehydrogenase [Acropora cervicornis]
MTLSPVVDQRLLGTRAISLPPNEPQTNLDKNSDDLEKLKAEIQRVQSETVEIPCIVGGKEIYTGNTEYHVAPYNHSLKIAKCHLATEEVITEAIESAMAARKEWERMPHEDRGAIFQKVADLIAGKYRIPSLAATMVGQAKTAYEADIDCVQELADFYRFGVHYAKELHAGPELHQPPGVINRVIYRGLEGFVAAITPFNFTAINGNLSGTPAIVGNVMLWKPASPAILAASLVQKIFQEAGLPDGVVNFLPAAGKTFGDSITKSPHLAGINFTGSVETFPRLGGECGGKNFHFIHPSADVDSAVNCTIRSAFGFSGQKCSACSRLYVPESLWGQVKESLVEKQKDLKLGSPEDYDTFMSAVIHEKVATVFVTPFRLRIIRNEQGLLPLDETRSKGNLLEDLDFVLTNVMPSFKKIKSYIDYAQSNPDLSILAGGKCDDSVGYFVEPTIIETENPEDKIMKEEIFGPVLTVYVYPDQKYKETLELMDRTSPFGLTGAIFAKDRYFIREASDILKDATGNFYINDKSTGSIVGQQPFGGARLSGSNDKAGSSHYIMKWVSIQSIKETVVPTEDYKYPHQS